MLFVSVGVNVIVTVVDPAFAPVIVTLLFVFACISSLESCVIETIPFVLTVDENLPFSEACSLNVSGSKTPKLLISLSKVITGVNFFIEHVTVLSSVVLSAHV